MSSVRKSFKIYFDNLFARNLKQVEQIEKSHFVFRSYKILLGLCFLCGFPYFPSQLDDADESIHFVRFLSFLFAVCRSFIFIFCIYYDHFVFPYHSLALTFDDFFLCCLIAIWFLYFKSRDVLRVMKTVIALSDQVNPQSFKCQFKIFTYIFASLIGCMALNVPIVMRYLEVCERVNQTSKFLSYEIGNDHDDLLCIFFASVRIVTVISSGMVIALMKLISSTIYYHFGDIIMNFASKLKRTCERKLLDQSLLLDNLLVFGKITELSQSIDDALSWTVLVVYAAIFSCFFIGVAMIHLFQMTPALGFVLLGMFIFATDAFLSITLTGERVKRKNEQLRDVISSCSYSLINRDLNEKVILWFSLMSTDIKSKDLRVTAGRMFAIDNQIILSVTGMLVTYGVLMFQMD